MQDCHLFYGMEKRNPLNDRNNYFSKAACLGRISGLLAHCSLFSRSLDFMEKPKWLSYD